MDDMKNFYEQRSAYLSVSKNVSIAFKADNGLRQGCGMSAWYKMGVDKGVGCLHGYTISYSTGN